MLKNETEKLLEILFEEMKASGREKDFAVFREGFVTGIEYACKRISVGEGNDGNDNGTDTGGSG